jgi:predicted transcriptional regulator
MKAKLAGASKLELFTFQNLLNTLPPVEVIEESEPVRKALVTMCSKNYSQLPVIKGDVCTGSITFDSILLQLKIADQKGYNVDMGWPIKRFIDQNPPRFVKKDDAIVNNVDWLASNNFVFVGSPKQIEGIATNYDLVLFFKKETESFLLISEIENVLRHIIYQSLTAEELGKSIDSIKVENGRILKTFSDLSFDHLRQVIFSHWKIFEVIFKNQEMTDKQLQNIRNLRNEIFHFRSSIGAAKLQDLRRLRDNYVNLALSTPTRG